MKVLILAPSAIGHNNSHDANALLNHTSIFLDNDISVVWGLNRSSNLSMPSVVAHRIFDYSIYDDFKLGRTNLKKRIWHFFYYQKLISKTMDALSDLFAKESTRSTDHVFVPTADWLMLRALHKLQKQTSLDRWPSLKVELMCDKANWMTGGYPYDRVLEKLNQLRISTNTLFVYTEVSSHANYASKQLGFDVPVYPYPTFPVPRDSESLASNRKIVIGVLGGGRRDKGFHLLPDIVAKFNVDCHEDLEVDFLIQKPRTQEHLEVELNRLSQHKNVGFISESISSNEYEDVMESCSILLLPYTSNYKFRGSGVAVEALANGIPIVCTDNTGLVDVISHENGRMATTVNEFSEALLSIASDLTVYEKRAAEASKKYLIELLNNPVVSRIKETSNS
jgi:glycosyltransferase involved in cell wall biosynthesis